MTTTAQPQCVLNRTLTENSDFIIYDGKSYNANSNVLNFTFDVPPISNTGKVMETNNGCKIEQDHVNKLISLTQNNVREINFNNINMSDFIDSKFTFGNLPQLRILHLMGTNITNNILLYFLRRVPNIEELNLNNNMLQSFNFRDIQTTQAQGGATSSANINLGELKILKLTNTNINDINLNYLLSKTPKLRELYFIDNDTSNYSENMFTFNNLLELKELYLYNVLNNKSIPLTILYILLNKFPNLEILILGGNRLSQSTTITLNPLPKLDILILDNTNITSINLKKILNQTLNITTLGLKNNFNIDDKYVDDVKDSFKNLTKLKDLDINREPDSPDQFMDNSTITKIVDGIILPNPSIDTISLPYVKDYDYANLTVKKYNKVLISVYKELDGKPEITKEGYIIYDLIDKTAEINNFRKGINYTTLIITTVLLIICFMLFNYIKNM